MRLREIYLTDRRLSSTKFLVVLRLLGVPTAPIIRDRWLEMGFVKKKADPIRKESHYGLLQMHLLFWMHILFIRDGFMFHNTYCIFCYCRGDFPDDAVNVTAILGLNPWVLLWSSLERMRRDNMTCLIQNVETKSLLFISCMNLAGAYVADGLHSVVA